MYIIALDNYIPTYSKHVKMISKKELKNLKSVDIAIISKQRMISFHQIYAWIFGKVWDTKGDIDLDSLRPKSVKEPPNNGTLTMSNKKHFISTTHVDQVNNINFLFWLVLFLFVFIF